MHGPPKYRCVLFFSLGVKLATDESFIASKQQKRWFNLPKVGIITTSLRHSTWLSLFMLQELSQTKHTFQVGEFWWYSARKCWVQSDSSSWVLSLSWKWYFNSWLRKLVLFIVDIPKKNMWFSIVNLVYQRAMMNISRDLVKRNHLTTTYL